jgi:hypothetical protein
MIPDPSEAPMPPSVAGKAVVQDAERLSKFLIALMMFSLGAFFLRVITPDAEVTIPDLGMKLPVDERVIAVVLVGFTVAHAYLASFSLVPVARHWLVIAQLSWTPGISLPKLGRYCFAGSFQPCGYGRWLLAASLYSQHPARINQSGFASRPFSHSSGRHSQYGT